MRRISVIVPVYRAEKFLSRCINSILSQDVSDLELILVDDGSPDRSGEICDAYASKDARITVIHQKNKGVSAARNAGLERATGKFITFVDSDDAIAPGMYRAMLEKADETSAEIIGCGVQYFTEDGQYKRSDLQKELDYDRDMMLSALYDLPDPLGGSCCNKLFLAQTISGLRYEESVAMGEDWLFLFASFRRATRLYKLPDPFYCVTEHPNSSSRKTVVSIPVQILKTSKKMTRLAKAYSFSLGSKAVRKYLDDCLKFIRQIRLIGESTKTHYRRLILRRKCGMAHELFWAILRRRIPKTEVHRFLYGLLKV